MKERLKFVQTAHDEVPPEKLRWKCPLDLFDFQTTNDLKSTPKIIGQPRAIQAIKTGLQIKHPGYNIYVSGLTGTGRSSTVNQILKQVDKQKEVPDDKLYVHNFKDNDRPRLIRLPAGKGKSFCKDMQHLVESFRQNLPSIFESDEYKNSLEALTDAYRTRQRDIFQRFEKIVSEAGFAVVQIQTGKFTRPDLMPVLENNPVQWEDLEKMVSEQKYPSEKLEEQKKQYFDFKKELDKVLASGHDLERKLREEIEMIIRKFGSPYIEDLINDIQDRYQNPSVSEFLDEIQEYTLAEIPIFLKKEDKPATPSGGVHAFLDPFKFYKVNLLVDNSRCKRPPVIIETAPNYKNLFGTIEKMVDRTGNWLSDFTNIKAGSILRADGGVLVINLMEALIEPLVWKTLKRTLKYGQLEIDSPEALSFFGQSALKPEPIKLELKVVLIGDKQSYLFLYHYDEDFKKIFKISADFDDQMDRNKQHILDCAGFIKRLCDQEKILPFDPSGVAAIIEQSIRMTDRQDKLSTRFSDVADLIRESGFWARDAQSDVVTNEHVMKAVEQNIYRRSLIENRIQEYYDEGMIIIDTSGRKTGQINGLAVYNYGDASFGKPTRITATISFGRAGIINIEREAELSGKIHDKGIQILSGYLRSQFAQDKPLALTASICFEQSYGGVDGDSASSTELYLLLATLADLPIRQDIAVTGSVNQHGEIQPIGGANEKIEGFFDICRQRRLTGTQGVIIPIQNLADLQLRQDVVDAVANGRFHIWAVECIEDGLEILTGVQAGKRTSHGKWEKNTIFDRVDRKLTALALGIQEFFTSQETKSAATGTRPPKGPAIPPPPKQPTRKDDDETDRN